MWTAAATWFVRTVAGIPADTPTAAAATAAATVAQGDGDPNVFLYLLGGGSAVTILGMIGKGIASVMSGRAAAATRRDMGLVEQRDAAWEERDEERAKREQVEVDNRARIRQAEDEARRRVERAERNLRRMTDHAGALRYLCRIHGVPDTEIPTFPRLEHDPDDPDDPAPTSGPTPAVS